MTRKLYIIAAGGVAFVILFWAGLAFTSGPGFCGSCHIMKPYKASHAESKHMGISCSECHVPHALLSKIPYKIKSGTRDIIHTISRSYPPVLSLKDDSKQILLTNCRGCHEATLERVGIAMNAKPCYECHRNIVHPRLDQD